jgi:hypothetical protein
MEQPKDMQEKETVRAFVTSDPATKLPAQIEYEYRCTACRQLVARMSFKLSTNEVNKVMNRHKCLSMGKKDFEEELRSAQ